MIHTVKGFGIVNKAEIDAFLGLSCFFDDPADFAIGCLYYKSLSVLLIIIIALIESLSNWKF